MRSPLLSIRVATAPVLVLVAVLLTSGTGTLRGQSALDGFDPEADDEVNVVAIQSDGKILIGGAFLTLSPNGAPVARHHIARLNPDGTLDTVFNPNAGGDFASVNSIALQADGKILVGGGFSSIGGQPRNGLARIDPTTGLADSFDPNVSGVPFAAVSAIVAQAGGKILVVGTFSNIGGQSHKFIARIDAMTGLVDSFNPNVNGAPLSRISCVAVQADGKILIGGNFDSVGGQTRNGIARLNSDGTLDTAFDPNANPASVSSIAIQPGDGKILVGGFFNGSGSIGGQTRNYIARLDPTTGLADSFDPNANSGVLEIHVAADGNILVGGNFTNIGGQPRNNIARLDPVTGMTGSFNPSANSSVYSIAVQADGKIVAGGSFTTFAPNGGAEVIRRHIARLETDGRLDQTLNISAVGNFVAATAVQPDGKILIGGNFTNVLGMARNYIARLNSDGSLDTAFDPNANSYVYVIAFQPDGKILVGGEFNDFNGGGIGGQPRNGIARLDPTTGLADSWNPNANGPPRSITVQADGKILVGGQFFSIGGQTRPYIARLDPVTGVADSWNPNASTYVQAILPQPDGKILVGGWFFNIGGQPRNYIARLDPVTGLADSFNPNAEDWVYSIALDQNGKILVGGWFNSIGGQSRNSIARLDPITGLADSWNPNANGPIASVALQADGKILIAGGFNDFNGGTTGGQPRNYIARLDPVTGLADSFNPNANFTVSSIAVQADGKVLAGGNFMNIGGQQRNVFARLTNDTAAEQFLFVTQSTIIWAHEGSSPHLTGTTFEFSNDNANYTPIGEGTATGSNWTLIGLDFPTRQSFYIRARGHYRSGQAGGSESITESVRNIFLVPPTITSANNITLIVGSAGAFNVTTAGNPAGTSMSIGASGPLPTGVTFIDNNNGTATLAGTPNTSTEGSYPITITATNGVSPNASQNFTLTVITATPTPTPSPTPTPTPLPSPAQALNISTRMRVDTGTNVLIAGFIVTGNTPKNVAIRGIGPSLAAFGIPDPLSDPTVELHDSSGALLSQNDNWEDDPSQAAQLAALGLGLQNPNESGIIASLQPNAYTAILAGKKGGTGVGLVEVYDTNQAANSQLANISTRGTVLTDSNVMIGGFILGGNSSTHLVIRGIGPSLAHVGVPNVLVDPTLELHDSNGVLLVENDNWQDDSVSASQLSALGLAPPDTAESGTYVSLPPGAFTAILAGKNSGIGVGLLEVYNVQ